jgi:NADPH2:quinone reductase
MKGMTAQYLFQGLSLSGGETILPRRRSRHRLIACQWARALGVTMIGTVSSDESRGRARMVYARCDLARTS